MSAEPEQSCCETQGPLYLNTQQYPTQSSGYTARLQRNAQLADSMALLDRANGRKGMGAVCPPLAPIKVQANSGAYTKQIQKCFNYAPTISRGCDGVIIEGISAGGKSSSAYTLDLATDPAVQAPFNPETRFDAYKPYEYPVVPSTIIFTSPTIPVPNVDACLLPGVNQSGPNPISSQPTAVTVTAPSPPAPGYFNVSWTPGNDRSIVKYNIYVNNGKTPVIENIEATTATLGPYTVPSSGTLQIQPIAKNNWRGEWSEKVPWTIA